MLPINYQLVILELRGKDSFIVCEDVDVDNVLISSNLAGKC